MSVAKSFSLQQPRPSVAILSELQTQWFVAEVEVHDGAIEPNPSGEGHYCALPEGLLR